MSYNDLYADHDHYFGSEPERMLVTYLHLLDPRLPVLDVGCGQGRNALFLARSGRRVVAIDPSTVAIDSLARLAGAAHLPIDALACGFDEYRTGPSALGGVLLLGIVQILDREGIGRLVDGCRRWVAPGGCVFITAFSTDDPRREKHEAEGELIGRNSFLLPGAGDREMRTYLEPGEILELFRAWEVVHHWEGLGPEHRHGGGAPERHGRIEALFRKQA